MPGQLTVPGDPFATAAMVAARSGLFALDVGGDAVMMMMAEIALAVMLFAMFRPCGAVIATAAMAARLMMVAVMAAMLRPRAALLAPADPEAPLVALDARQRVELAWAPARMDDAGVRVWRVFFALHLCLLGTLVWRSGRVPRILAAALVIGGSGYHVDSIRAFAFPGSGRWPPPSSSSSSRSPRSASRCGPLPSAASRRRRHRPPDRKATIDRIRIAGPSGAL